MFITKLFFLLNLLCNIASPALCNNYPTIIMHGLASDKNELELFSNSLSKLLIGKSVVYNMEIGNGKLTSMFMNLDEQCAIFSDNIRSLNITNEKINIIGFSQGGLIARCYLEEYSHKIIKVNTLITIATPHMGVYNEPKIIPPVTNCYWKNPFQYYNTNNFILYLNNEIEHINSETYRNNIKLLSNFIIIWSNIENVITPRESSKFEYYNIEKAINEKILEIVPFLNSSLYMNDSLGMKYLYSYNKLIFYEIDCKHEEFKLPTCFNDMGLLNIIVKYL